jgi:hypothetical protein
MALHNTATKRRPRLPDALTDGPKAYLEEDDVVPALEHLHLAGRKIATTEDSNAGIVSLMDRRTPELKGR